MQHVHILGLHNFDGTFLANYFKFKFDIPLNVYPIWPTTQSVLCVLASV